MTLQKTIKNRTIFCRDNLELLRGVDSNTIDLIYLDPPFHSKREYHAPIGSQAEGAGFKDIFAQEDVKEEWLGLIADQHPAIWQLLSGAGLVGHRSDKYYLAYMAVRLLHLQRILCTTGSLYLHCDPTMSHWLKLLLDAVFGRHNFRNEIIWGYRTGGISKRHFPRKHDVILCYGKDAKKTTHQPIQERVYYDNAFFTTKQDDHGRHYADVYIRDVWDDSAGIKPVNNMSGERHGYPTQKPLGLLRRIIAVSSKEGDVVLDPFCGCATTCVAAEQLGRQWVGMDVSLKAFDLVKVSLQREIDKMALAHGNTITQGDITLSSIISRDDIPTRCDGVVNTLTLEKKHALYGKQTGNCNLCRHHFKMRHLEIDHIVPKAQGSGDESGNLQLLCGHCNRVKGTKTNEEALVRLRELQIISSPRHRGVNPTACQPPK